MKTTQIFDLGEAEDFPVLFVNPKMRFWPIEIGYYTSNCWKTKTGEEIVPEGYKEFYKVEF